MLSLHLDRVRRVVAIGAHPDDVEIGAGGTLLRLAAQPDLQVRVVVLTSTPRREAETRACLAAMLDPVVPRVDVHQLPDTRLPSHLDEVKDVLADVAAEPADLVLAPQPADAHQDHRLLGSVVPQAFRDHLVLHYEIPKWDGDLGSVAANTYVPMDASLMQRKWELLDEHHASQRVHDWWDREVFAGLARLRGMECRAPYAEAFRAERMVLEPAACDRETNRGKEIR